jgi:glycosyltransferase involved in cell wall biosynthesis
VRVAVVTTSFPLYPGQAAGHFVEAEVLERRRRGEQVIVFAPGPSHAGQRETAVFRIPCAGLFGPPGALPRLRSNPLRALGGIEFILRARRALKLHGPFDRIVAHWILPSAYPIATGLAPCLEAVAHGSDVRLLARLPRFVRSKIARELLREGTVVRCVSDHVRSQLIAATLPELLPRTCVAPSPFVLPPGLDRSGARARLGLDAERRLLVIVSRLVPGKRVATALDAVALIADASVVVVGGGPLLGRLSRDYPSVRFTGELPRPLALDWIAAADVLLSASQHEGAPTTVREARALGTRVVACAAGSLPALAESDDGIWIVPDTVRR